MNRFFEFLYGLFVSIYGTDLDTHLLGGQCQDNEIIWDGKFLYTPIGIVTIAIAAAFFVLYYYIINSARLNKWWHWLIVLILVGIVNLFVGYVWTYNDLPNVSDCLTVYPGDCWLFGLANMIVSFILFVIFSFAGKWGSSSCRRTPF